MLEVGPSQLFYAFMLSMHLETNTSDLIQCFKFYIIEHNFCCHFQDNRRTEIIKDVFFFLTNLSDLFWIKRFTHFWKIKNILSVYLFLSQFAYKMTKMIELSPETMPT